MSNRQTSSYILVGLLIVFIIISLTNAGMTAQFAYLGLEIWFKKMIPSLFPMMVIMNFLILSNLTDVFIRPVSFFLKPLFQISDTCIFVIFFGFLCGFPLGCKSTVDLYTNKKITFTQAEYLLCFCNQLGPAYFLGFVLKEIYTTSHILGSVFLMYGIPFLYGLFLRYTIYAKKEGMRAYRITDHGKECITKLPNTTNKGAGISYSATLSQALENACMQMTLLGGYMIVFNVLRIIPTLLYQIIPVKEIYLLLHSILEVSGGLYCISQNLNTSFEIFVSSHALLAFSGLCCYFQSVSILSHTNLSAKKYMLHRLIICSITIIIICICS